MSLNRDIDVNILVNKYRKKYPNAPKAEIRTMVRLDYEKYCGEHKISDTRQKATFLRKLDRRLEKEFCMPTIGKTSSPKPDLRITWAEKKIIKEVIQEHYPGGTPSPTQIKYKPSYTEEDVMKEASFRIKKDYLDPGFRRVFLELLKEFSEEAP
jgi:hypothetical protein